MQAEDAYKITVEVLSRHSKDNRLDKYLEYLDRDIKFEAGRGKFFKIVDYTDRPITEEFVFKLQEFLRGEGFVIEIDEDNLENYRKFIIRWNKDE